jgi:NADH-quinone oxidoreductase subunit M
MADMAAGGAQLPVRTQVLVFLGLLLGFGVKMPIVPLHGWLPLAHVEAPSPISILLSGILLKMGAYGLIRAAATCRQRCRRCRTGWRCWPDQPDLRCRAGLAADRSESDDRLLVDLAHGRRVLLGIAALNEPGSAVR